MSFKKVNISYKETGLFSKVFTDYLQGDPTLTPFYEYPPTIKAFGDAVKNMGVYEYPRKVLADSLKEYYEKNASETASDATLKNIQKLEEKNCFTVTTGHQLCLFTGPLYFIYKIITAINLAEKLNKEHPKNHFVPVYWMASEDHDFAEINHANLFGKKVAWNVERVGGPVGKMSLQSLSSTLYSLYEIMGELGENTKDLKKLIAESYSPEKTLAEATFCFVNALFGKYGLVVIEPDNASLKQVFSSVIIDELVNGDTFKLVAETNQKLAKAGVEAQVNPREINLFYIDEQGRNRIEKKDDKYEILNTATIFSQDEIIGLVKNFPEKFSPNVLLRPVHQQAILPNVAYIGGPSEMVYWLELKDVFTHYNVPFPVLMPRNSALIINTSVTQKMEKLNISAKDLFKQTDVLIKELLRRNFAELLDVEKETAKIKAIYSSLEEKVQKVDPTLVPFLGAQLQKQLNVLKALETKLMRLKKHKEESSVNQVRKLKETLFPGGALHDRTDSFIPFYLQQGSAFIDALKKNFDPFEFSVTVLVEE